MASDRAIGLGCRLCAQANGLTQREEEVLELMARGRNGAYIEGALCVSRNTVKTHVRHVYAKLNVHTQQELIDLVENYGRPQ